MFEGLLAPTHLIVLLVIVLLLFGAKRIPELARGLGSGVREFKRGTQGVFEEEARGEKEKPVIGGGSEDEAGHRNRDGAV